MRSLFHAALLMGILSATVAAEQTGAAPAGGQRRTVPKIEAPPRPRPRSFGIPSITTEYAEDGEIITLRNDVLAVRLQIDAQRRIRIVSLRTARGRELLASPAACFSILDGQGTIVLKKSGKQSTQAWQAKQQSTYAEVENAESDTTVSKRGATFRVESWFPRRNGRCAEVEIRLTTPEHVIWRLRLCRDRPYLEQCFEMPPNWRTAGRAVVQVLPTSESLRPVMPIDAFGRGFSQGRPKLDGRHRFEFVGQSDHLLYDPRQEAGLAGFVAGIGGEERIRQGRFTLLDHVSTRFGEKEPIARFLLWPFDGAVETGFMCIRDFIREEYSQQSGNLPLFSWNQFWLWQGGMQPAGSEVVTAKRLLDILPHVAAVGCEEFHMDSGWQQAIGDWRFDPKRFPDGFEPLRRFLRERSMRYHTWMTGSSTDDTDLIAGLIDETDLAKLFMDRTVDENSIACLRRLRGRYPGFECLANRSTSRSKYYPWGNIHFLADFNQLYFGESEFWGWSNVLPGDPQETDANKRFFSKHSLRAGDLVTRCASYQVNWAWPYQCIMPPHYGWAWFEERDPAELQSRMFTTIAARYDYGWGFDPRMLRKELLDFFLDWTAFFKTARSRLWLCEYQHILPPPDGIHPDGAAHVKDGRGFLVLCNPGRHAARVTWKELLWEPELALDPTRPVELTDWTTPLVPAILTTVDIASPTGSLILKPLSYRVIGVNVDVAAFSAQMNRHRQELEKWQHFSGI